MTARDVIDAAYGRATSFGRDVFHYVVTGTVFALFCSAAIWSRIPDIHTIKLPPVAEPASVQLALLGVVLVALFGAGHVLLAVGFCIRRWWLKIFARCEHVVNYHDAEERIKALIGHRLTVDADRHAHVYPEMTVFVTRPELHANFIERYNTLWHLRLGLAASMLFAAFIDIVIGFLCCELPPLVVGVVAVVLGLLLVRQHLVTHTNFFDRIAAAFSVVKPE